MYNNNLIDISNSFLEFISLIRDTMLNEKDIYKKISCTPKEFQDYMDKYPMPASHIKVIHYLIHNNSCPISQIAKNLNISKPNMTPIIDKLITYGFVKRYTDPDDRRIIRVELTPKAINKFEDIKKILAKNLCKRLSILSEKDLESLSSSLNNLSAIIRKL